MMELRAIDITDVVVTEAPAIPFIPGKEQDILSRGFEFACVFAEGYPGPEVVVKQHLSRQVKLVDTLSQASLERGLNPGRQTAVIKKISALE
jgi:hypothetical protein